MTPHCATAHSARTCSSPRRTKVKIALRLDELGMDYIEGGWPGANPVDSEFFREVVSYRLKTAKISAFGSTHHPSHTAENDPTLMALLACGARVLTIFGKSSERHARDALRLEPSRNLDIIRDSVAFLRSRAEEVFFDAEHFFDGWEGKPRLHAGSVEARA